MDRMDNFIVPIAEDLQSPETKNVLLDLAVLANAMAVSLSLLVTDAIEKVFNARLSTRKEAAKHLSPEFRTDILVSDPFLPELCSTNQ